MCVSQNEIKKQLSTIILSRLNEQL